MNKKIIISHNLCERLFSLSDNGIYTYILLKSQYVKTNEEYYVAYDSLNYILTKKIKANQRDYENIKNGILELDKTKFIQILNLNPLIINTSNLFYKNEKTIKVINEDIEVDIFENSQIEYVDKKIHTDISTINLDSLSNCLLECKGKKNILKYLIYILMKKSENVSKDNKEMLYVSLTLDEIIEDVKMSKKSIIKYNKLLQDNDIIYIDKSIGKHTLDGYSKLSNKYMRYCDKEKYLEFQKK